MRNGILRSFSFDRNGDTTAGSVTIYRVHGGKPDLVGLITPSPALVHSLGRQGDRHFARIGRAAHESTVKHGRAKDGVGFANSGGLVFVDESAEEIATV